MKKELSALTLSLIMCSLVGCKSQPEAMPQAEQQMEAPAQTQDVAPVAPETQNPAENEGK